jgi:hypothetical protein
VPVQRVQGGEAVTCQGQVGVVVDGQVVQAVQHVVVPAKRGQFTQQGVVGGDPQIGVGA